MPPWLAAVMITNLLLMFGLAAGLVLMIATERMLPSPGPLIEVEHDPDLPSPHFFRPSDCWTDPVVRCPEY